MNFQINVTFDVTPRLETLLATLLSKTVTASAVPVLAGMPANNMAPPTNTDNDGPRPEQAQAPPPGASVSLEELRATASAKGKAIVKPLLEEYGFASITAIPENAREAFKARLEAA